MDNEKDQAVKIVVPWPGPVGDEWDSPSYNDFWGPVEQHVNQQILKAQSEGKQVELVGPTPKTDLDLENPKLSAITKKNIKDAVSLFFQPLVIFYNFIREKRK